MPRLAGPTTRLGAVVALAAALAGGILLSGCDTNPENATHVGEGEAIKLGGSSVSDYVDSEGREGFFQLQHRVYLRTGEPCLTCKTAIKRTVVAGRGTHYCPKCQK